MTICDAFTIYARRCHSRTLRPHLGFQVRNPNNDLRGGLPLSSHPRNGGGLDPEARPHFNLIPVNHGKATIAQVQP